MKVKVVRGNHFRMENNKLVCHRQGSIIEVTQKEFDDYPGKFEPAKAKPESKKER